MKRIWIGIALLATVLCCALSVGADGGKVTYDGRARECVFAPGSAYSLTDLFANFKGVMPGDTLTQKITVKNDASDEVKVEIYLRSLGAHEGSAEFLSKLGLTVATSADNEMAYMFDAAAHETAGLTDWVCLGTLYAGGEVNLDVTLHVPTELDNRFQNAVGYLDWEFMIKEYPVEADDPVPPDTGEHAHTGLWIAIMGGSLALLLLLLLWRKKGNDDE